MSSNLRGLSTQGPHVDHYGELYPRPFFFSSMCLSDLFALLFIGTFPFVARCVLRASHSNYSQLRILCFSSSSLCVLQRGHDETSSRPRLVSSACDPDARGGSSWKSLIVMFCIISSTLCVRWKWASPLGGRSSGSGCLRVLWWHFE